jgi:cell division protein FtsB
METTNKDLGSVLAHVENLQKQLAAKEAELKETKDREV